MFIEISYLTTTGFVRSLRVSRFVRNLSFRNCGISHINLRQLQKLRWLKCIDLSDNSIDEVDFTVLESMSHLEVILFRNNRITSIDFSTIKEEIYCRLIDLSGNHVSEVIAPKDNGLQMDTLNLSNNQLEQFDLMSILPYVGALKISGNRFSSIGYDKLPNNPTNKQKQKVDSFIKMNTRNKTIQDLDLRFSLLFAIFGGATLILVLFVRVSQPDYLNSVLINLGILNVTVSIGMPALYWWSKYHNRPDWKIALYKTLWMYFASIFIVIIGVFVSSISNIAFIFLQSEYDTIVINNIKTIINPLLSIGILYIWTKSALAHCNLIDLRWVKNAYKSPSRIQRIRPTLTSKSITQMDTYVAICSVYRSLDYLMLPLVFLNYITLWPLYYGFVITNLSRYFISGGLALALVLVLLYFLWKTVVLLRDSPCKQVGILDIHSQLDYFNQIHMATSSDTVPSSYFHI